MIQETLLPHLFFGNTKSLSPIVGAISTMPVKKFGLGLLNPVTPAQDKYLCSQRGSAELVWAVTGEGEFSNADHLRMLGEEIWDRKKDQGAAYTTKIKVLVRDLKGTNKRLILRSKSTVAWLSVRGTKGSGKVISAKEFWDILYTHYNVYPQNLHIHCGVCGTVIVVTHTFRCRIGGLVISCHNKICDKLLYISQRVFTSA